MQKRKEHECGDKSGKPQRRPHLVRISLKSRRILAERHASPVSRAVSTEILQFSERVLVTPGEASVVFEKLSGVVDRAIIISMSTTTRLQQRYDHRLRNLVQRTGATRPEGHGAAHRLALGLLQTSGFHLAGARLPDGRAKMRILRAVDRTREYLRFERPCGSCVSRRVGFTPGAGSSALVRSTITPFVRAHPRLD